MEALGAIAAILVAFMPLQVLFGKDRPSFVFISAGFLAMGLLDLSHSIYEIGQGFVFTHAIALLAGGFFFALFVFPWKIDADKVKPRLLLFAGTSTILLIVLVSLNRELFPRMLNEGVFTPAANSINVLAALLFLISAVKLVVIYIEEKKLGVLVLIFTALSSAIVGFTFQFSEAWIDTWWLWHIIRLIAFLALLVYTFSQIQTISKERDEALRNIKENNDLLRESEERFRLVNEATSHGLWDWDVINNEVYFSPVWKMQVGYRDDELENIFDNWAKLLHPEDAERSFKAVADYQENPDEKFIIEFRFRHKSGHYVWIHNEAASVKNEQGKVIRMFGAHTDISAQKIAEQKLQDREKQFRIIFEDSPLGKSRTGLDGSLNINKAFSEITGYELQELQQKNWKEITHPDDVKISEEVIQSLISGEKKSVLFEKRYIHKAGHYVWTEVSTSLHRNEDGEPQFFITAISDITQRKEAEEYIRQSEKKFKGLFENDPSAVFIADPETGLLHDVNPAAERLMEMSRDEMIGMHQSKLHPEEIMLEQQERFKNLLNQPNISLDSEILTRAGKRKPVEIKVSMVEIENKPYILGIFHDISKLAEQHQKIRESEEKFRNLFNSVSIPLCHVEEDGKIESMNDRFKKDLGWTLEDIPTISHWWEKAYPDKKYREWAIKNWNEAVQFSIENGTDIKSDVYHVTCKNGDVRQIIIAGITFGKKLLATFIDVTEQRKAEEVIIQEKEYSEMVINALPGIFYLFNEQGKYLKWNNMLEELSGFTAEEIAEKSPLDYFADYHKEKVTRAVETTFKEGKISVEADFMLKGEIPTPFYFTGHTIELEGKPHLLGVGLDISQRKKAEREKDQVLNELNKRMKELTCLYEVNESIKNTREDVPGVMKKIIRFIPKGWHYPEKTVAEIMLDDTNYQRKGSGESEYYLLENIMVNDKERGYIKVSIVDADSQQSKMPFLEEEKELLKTIAGNVSIYVNRVETEKAILESEEKFRNVFSGSPVSLWEEDWTEIMEMIYKLKKKGVKDYKKYFSENRQFVNKALTKVVVNDVNKATLEMFEAESKDDLVKSLEVVFATEDTLPVFINELVALAEGKRVYEAEMKLNTVKGNMINAMLRMAFPAQERQHGQVLVSIMDITELQRAQEQLKVSMENLQRSNKELEQFAYVASHDLQEPLRMVASYTQLLERRYKDQLDERANKYIYYAVDGAKRMQNLINDLLDVSRISTRGDKFTITDTNEVVKNALKSLEARIDETGARIKTGKLPLINADSGQIERLFMNLVGNALKFSKPDEKPFIEIDASEQKNNWLFRVKDNGIGIDEKFKEKVFVIFQRLHGTTHYKGTGIGLAICKRIVQRHEGEIWFESEENKGTTFYFTLKKHTL
ncbi:MAG: PAS domain S-box protein [Bacteroidales bacterium]|nr:PAS domain S-box protein [Bacteroidales bacterium]